MRSGGGTKAQATTGRGNDKAQSTGKSSVCAASIHTEAGSAFCALPLHRQGWEEVFLCAQQQQPESAETTAACAFTAQKHAPAGTPRVAASQAMVRNKGRRKRRMAVKVYTGVQGNVFQERALSASSGDGRTKQDTQANSEK